jgi:sporulation protein YlmC with PRC-barrel domain
MQHSISSITGYEIRATDGDLGKMDEIYFDDETWTARYIVVETGNWLSNRKVLISPVAFGKLQSESRSVVVNLTTAQVSGSPDIDTQRPIYRQHEVELNKYYQLPWRGGYGGVFGTTPLPLSEGEVLAEQKASGSSHRNDPHLRSSRQVTGYHIHAIDGEIGHVDDFMIDDETWEIRLLVVDTRNWLPGKKVLLSPQWIQRVEWADSSVHFDLTRESIKNSPEFDPSKADFLDYEVCLCDHYGKPLKKHKIHVH